MYKKCCKEMPIDLRDIKNFFQVPAEERAFDHGLEGSSEREHHAAHPLPAATRLAAQHLHHTRRRLRRPRPPLNHQRGNS